MTINKVWVWVSYTISVYHLSCSSTRSGASDSLYHYSYAMKLLGIISQHTSFQMQTKISMRFGCKFQTVKYVTHVAFFL
jgi:hypothetical protein